MNFGPAYRIHTARLVIRCWEPRDAPLLKASIDRSLPHLRKWMPWAKQEPQSLEEKVQQLRHFRGMFDLGHDYVYGVFDGNETEVVGGTGLHTRAGDGSREIGYWVDATKVRLGVGTELTQALVRVGFEVDALARIEVHVDPDNTHSWAIPKKLGFTLEGTLRERLEREDGSLGGRMVWTMLRSEYATSPIRKVPIKAFDAVGRVLLGG